MKKEFTDIEIIIINVQEDVILFSGSFGSIYDDFEENDSLFSEN